jgi:transcriptional regulator with XRE-family HTH domain
VHPADRRLSQPGGLAARLYLLRQDAGLTGDQLAAALGWGEKTGRTKVSKIENGRQLPSADEIRSWVAACGHPEALGELLGMLADVQAVHRSWRGRLRHGNAAVQDDYDRRARAAKRFRNSAPLVIPSLVQTAGYARAILTQVARLWGTEDVDAAVEARMRRQEILYDQSRTFEFVITEAALRLPPCQLQVMAGQLDRLLSLDLDNVTLGIIPMGVPLAVVPFSDFLLLDDRAIVESHGSEDEVGEEESAVYERIFAELMAEAVTGNEARQLITRAAQDLRQGPST